ncbi:MAG: isocitrate/isopropylmalate family dehydrogenase [Gammaproteobacteria bacterium]|nr:isocitrate/isopropylmalate family dehydrogenase [Gammaproteobacteria bacterium]MDD9824777.1 isocitrate/isopropylmalate family dehydrogenase [Gammaproteobacteria bacterium]MDD9862992.1 isocitrate/isopropylmalate family dehydrogenase [Gammaproteobacteria bacterium]
MKPIPATLIEGDGVGPEIMAATLEALDALGSPFRWDRQQAGAAAVEKHGDALPEPVLASIRQTRLALKAPLNTPIGTGFRSANVRLREIFNLYANVRPARSLYRGGRFEDIDLVLLRENTEGLYVGVEHYVPIAGDPKAVAEASGIITRFGCRRFADFGFRYALDHGRRKVTIVHKANILKTLTGLFLETAMEIGQRYRDRLEIEDRIVDNCAMQLVLDPSQFDLLLTTNMFGDILSEEIAGLVGGLGLAASGNIGDDAAIFEAVHGSAPDIAGRGVANPCALMLAATMMLEHVGEHGLGKRLRQVIGDTLQAGVRPPDLGGDANTRQFTAEIVRRLR